MDTLGKAELTSSIRHTTRFLKSGIPIYRTQENGKRYAFHSTQYKINFVYLKKATKFPVQPSLLK